MSRRPGLPGVYRAVVTDAKDPRRRNRVQVEIPSVSGTERSWAPLVVQPAGTPVAVEPGDEVIVAFEAGDPRSPIVLGTLWDSSDRPPA